MAVKLSTVKENLAKVIDELEAAIQQVMGGPRGRSIAKNSPSILMNDFPADFPGEAKEISRLIAAKMEKFSEVVDRAKESKEIPKNIIAVFQMQIKELGRLARYYRYVGKNKKLPGLMHPVLSRYNPQAIQGPLEEIKSKAKTGVA